MRRWRGSSADTLRPARTPVSGCQGRSLTQSTDMSKQHAEETSTHTNSLSRVHHHPYETEWHVHRVKTRDFLPPYADLCWTGKEGFENIFTLLRD